MFENCLNRFGIACDNGFESVWYSGVADDIFS